MIRGAVPRSQFEVKQKKQMTFAGEQDWILPP